MSSFHSHRTPFIEVFSSAQLWQIDTARLALIRSRIPHFLREVNFSGVEMAFPAAPTPAPGLSWTIVVPKPRVLRARRILSELPIEYNKQPEYFDFSTFDQVRRWVRIYAWVSLGWYVPFAILSAAVNSCR